MHNTFTFRFFLFACLFISFTSSSCNNSSKQSKNKNIVADPASMDENAGRKIESALVFAGKNNGQIGDSILLMAYQPVNSFYTQNKFVPVWSTEEKWLPIADSLLDFISNAKLNGLFPDDYHFKNLISVKTLLDKDSLSKMNASIWAKADVLLTDALIKIMRDLKQGRLQHDSITLRKDSLLGNNFYTGNVHKIIQEKSITAVLNAMQPSHTGYWELKNDIKGFLDSVDNSKYTYVVYPYKKGSLKDSLGFINAFKKRLKESGCFNDIDSSDGQTLTAAIKKFQQLKGLKADGKISSSLIKIMNVSDTEKFKRIAITLDKYKQLPETMPEKYIWVNLPGYYLQVWENDSMALSSNIICGKPETRTPLLNSDISDMITYPTWTVPNSIIVKQYLPKLRNNPNYLSRIGLKLINNKGEDIDPNTVNWGKYSKGIPYNVRQGSGDNNALGVIKFNFNNPYSVYLHDTNQRYLFKNSYRALSHGCVRVQDWEKLAYYIARNDSMNVEPDDTLKYTADSIRNWINSKSHKRIIVKNKIPLFIKYFTCENQNGKIKFYDDIYGEDKILNEKYFANK